MTDNNDNNVFSLVKDGAKQEEGLPQFDYVIETVDNETRYVHGFPVFSPQYVMIMREFPGGITIPTYMLPLTRLSSLELEEDEEDTEELPF